MASDSVRISGSFLLWSALLILILPLNWLLAVCLASVIHELAHLMAVYLLGGKLWGFSMGFTGARLEAAVAESTQQCLCILAGPISSLFLGLMAPYWPEIAVSGLIQGLFNLIPVMPLDGGRILNCIATDDSFPFSKFWVSAAAWILWILLFVLCFFL